MRPARAQVPEARPAPSFTEGGRVWYHGLVQPLTLALVDEILERRAESSAQDTADEDSAGETIATFTTLIANRRKKAGGSYEYNSRTRSSILWEAGGPWFALRSAMLERVASALSGCAIEELVGLSASAEGNCSKRCCRRPCPCNKIWPHRLNFEVPRSAMGPVPAPETAVALRIRKEPRTSTSLNRTNCNITDVRHL
jgi:hypothetical protein